MFSLISRRTVSRSSVVSPRLFSTTPQRKNDHDPQHRSGAPPGLSHLENPSAAEEVVHAEKTGVDPLGKDAASSSTISNASEQAQGAWDKVKKVAEDVKEKIVGDSK